jgi:hypothetical protein
MKQTKRQYQNRIGDHFGKPVFETITESNVTYIFDRVANSDQDGYPLDQLQKNEILFSPGLIYKKVVG